MNKLIIALFAALLFTIPTCGQNSDSAHPADGTMVYCLTISSQTQSLIKAESRAFEGENQAESALAALFQPPESTELESAFNSDVRLISLEYSDGEAHVDLSAEYAAMEGISLTLADACIVLTLTQFPEIDYVWITAAGTPHPQREAALFSRDDFLIGVLGLDPRVVDFELYFAGSDNKYLEREIQSISVRDSNYAQYMVDMLIGGPKNERLGPVIPEGAELLALTVEEGVCYVSFSEEFVTSARGDAASTRMTLVALANSLTGLDDIERVELAIDGAPLKEYFMYDLSGGMSREAAAIDSYRGTDTALFYLGLNGELVAIAARVPNDHPEGHLMSVLSEYLQRPAPTGLKKPFPEETSVLSLGIEGDMALLDLSEMPDPIAPYVLLNILAGASRVVELQLYVNGRPFGESARIAA